MTLTTDETLKYLDVFYSRLLEHRYRYYVLDAPVLDDFEYDFIEREYNRLAQDSGVRLMNMVDFDFKDPLAIEAGKRVEAKIDSYSLWEQSMQEVWTRLGRPSKQAKHG